MLKIVFYVAVLLATVACSKCDFNTKYLIIACCYNVWVKLILYFKVMYVIEDININHLQKNQLPI